MEEQIYESLYRVEDSHWWFRGRRAVIRALISRAGAQRDPRLLDAGCGTGRNLIEFGDAASRGVDFSETAVEFCRRRGLEGVTRSGLEELPFADDSFDLTLLIDVIEHVDDDVAVLHELRRVAAPAARLIITTPAYEWLWSAHDDTHHHRRRYRREQLEERALEAGWHPVQSTYFNTFLLPPIAAVRKLRRGEGKPDAEITPGALNGALEQPMRLEAAMIARGRRLPFGVSIGMACVAV